MDPDTGPDPGVGCEKIILQDPNLVTVPKLLISDLQQEWILFQNRDCLSLVELLFI